VNLLRDADTFFLARRLEVRGQEPQLLGRVLVVGNFGFEVPVGIFELAGALGDVLVQLRVEGFRLARRVFRSCVLGRFADNQDNHEQCQQRECDRSNGIIQRRDQKKGAA
jgi:hypothetical protein